MKKNFLFKGVSVLGAMLLLATSVMPTAPVFAEGEQACIVGTETCGTLADIVAVAANAGIQLEADIETSSAIEISNTLALDLNGHSITKEGAGYVIEVKANGDLTIKDTSSNGDGKVKFSDEDHAGTAIKGYKDSNITIEGGEYRGVFAVSVQEGTATINDGKFVGLANGNIATIHAYGGGTITINDGIFNGKPGENVLEGATKEGKVLYAGANANECENPEYFQNGVSSNPVYQPGYIIVNGGEFVGRLSLSNASSANYTIKGGTFDRNVVEKITCTNCVNNAYTSCTAGTLGAILYEGKTVVEESGRYIVQDIEYGAQIGETKYETLGEAITAAGGSDTVKLLKNIEISSAIEISKTLALDLNGHSIKQTGAGEVIRVTTAGNLTISDGGENGEIGYVNESTPGTAVHSLGTVTLNGGIYKGNLVIYVDGTSGQGTINGGDYYGLTNGNVATIYASNGGNITITDGNFNGKEGVDVFDGANKEGKVIYAGANYNMCEHPGYATPTGGTIVVEGGYFIGRISHSNGGTYTIKGGNFDRNAVVKLNCSDGITVLPASCNGTKPNNCEDGTLGALLYEGKTLVEEDGRYIVQDAQVVEEKVDVQNDTTAEGLPNTVSNDIANVEVVDSESDILAGAADKVVIEQSQQISDTDEQTTTAINTKVTSDLVSDTTKKASVLGVLDLTFWFVPVAGQKSEINGAITFSKPIKVKIRTNKKARIGVKHNADADGKYGTDLLVTDPSVDCTDASSIANAQYNGDEINPNNDGDVEIYSCGASTFVAYEEETKSSGGSSSGGGGGRSGGSSSSSSTDTANTNTGSAENDTANGDNVSDTDNTDTNNISDEDRVAADAQALKDGYSQEFIDAYNFARKNNITTMNTIREANMDAPLTRIAMAKMLSQYAINVLGKTPDTDKVVPTFPDVSAQLDADYNNGVTLAYQLGIMGIGIENFRPFAEVTRAEFGTALSRMLFGLADGEGGEWYKTHLDKLMNEKIITNDNPNLKELRGYVMIMLMRSAQ